MTVEIRIQDEDSLEIIGKFDLVDADGNAYGHHETVLARLYQTHSHT